MLRNKQCLVCGEPFVTGGAGNPAHKVVYCSRSCASKARAAGLRKEPERRICPVCKSEFLVGGRDNKPLGTRYCSHFCATAATRMPEIEKAARVVTTKLGRPPKTAKIIKTCKQCGGEWEQYTWEKDRSDYCSRECFHQSRIGKANPHAAVIPEERPCEFCGSVFLVGGVGNRSKIARFCSRTCAKQAMWAAKEDAHSPAREMSDLERTWFAGLFDGEGCIAWPRRHVHHSVRLDLPSTSRAILEKIVSVTGTGKLALYKPKGNPRHSPAWGWHCYGENARNILRQIYPWLIIKKEAAAVALGLVKVEEPPWTQRTRSTRAAERDSKASKLNYGDTIHIPGPTSKITFNSITEIDIE